MSTLSDNVPPTDGNIPPEPSSFFHGNVEAGLQSMRRRLLDLTGNNRLLNFRHTKTGALQFVDTAIDALCQHLLGGREAHFWPVLRPPKDASTSARDATAAPLSSGTPRRHLLPPAREAAERAGIPVSYDLERKEPGDPARLQTLFYPEDLETLLRRMASDARTAIEETGANMLHLVFGFLEYYESEDSDTPRLAPLLVLPVSFRKGTPDPHLGTDRYYLEQAGGTSLSANFCLQELLRRDFGIHLPDLEIGDDGETETPGEYFQRIQPLVAAQDRWQLRRRLTLTLLSFGKLLIYLDLDSKTWPPGQAPSDHPRVREFFEGKPHEGDTERATEYSLDAPAMAARVPDLIDNADSSQHSALVDALDGRNLVIEGPPGTGKSQTITNLIAAAMARGKSVLFVAEKLAALEVVRSRLNGAGLGAFCLELHSHKTQKRALLDDVSKRLRQSSFEDPASYEEKFALLNDQKRRLNEYSTQLQTAFGVRAKLAFDILGAPQRRRTELPPEVSASLEAVSLPGVAQMTGVQYEERSEALDQFGRHLAEVQGQSGGTVAGHPWHGIGNDALAYHTLGVVATRLRTVQDKVAQLQRAGNAMAARFRLSPPTTLAACVSLRAAVDELPASHPAQENVILPKLVAAALTPQVQTRLADFADRLRQAAGLRRQARKILGENADLSGDQPARLRQARERVAALCPASATLREAAGTADYFAWYGQEVTNALPPLADLQTRLHGEASEAGKGLRTTATLGRAAAIVQLANAAPLDALHLRALVPDPEAVLPVFHEARREAIPLLEARTRLGAKYRLAGLPAAEELGRMAASVANAGWFRFFDKEYQQAKKTYLGLRKEAGGVSRAEMQADLHVLAEYREQSERFHARTLYRASLGGLFDGLDTPFDGLDRLFAWLKACKEQLPVGAVGHALPEAAHDLQTASPERLSRLAQLRDNVERWQQLENQLSECRNDHWPSARDWPADLTLLGSALESLAAELRANVDAFTQAGVAADLALDPLTAALNAASQARLLESGLAGDQFAAQTLGADFRGPDTDPARIEATLDLVRGIQRVKVPAATQDWLLAEETSARLREIHAAAGALTDQATDLRTAAAAFAEAGGVDWGRWFGSPAGAGLDLESVSFGDYIARAEHALGKEELLSTYVDYLRARRTAGRLQLDPIIERAEQGRFAARLAPAAFAFVYEKSMAQALLSARPVLETFSGPSHESLRQRFAELDNEVVRLYRLRAASLISRQRPVPAGVAVGPVGRLSQRGLLSHEIAKQKRHIPIRKLLDRAGEALQALKPCFMMGPLSVAQYLKPGGLKFDLVIMDEASQLRPEEALGAIARGTQIVIVGDPKQLPPTDFFRRISDGTEEDDEPEEVTTAAQVESILDVASTLHQPLRRLRWHYRSRHESLIAFSNREFYDGDLIVFPSPAHSAEELGVKFEWVAEGIFRDRRNQPEAERVVDAALTHMRTHPDQSLGIVALNAPQKELIENLFEQRARTSSTALDFVARWEDDLEPFFIKNLENVQGDERDVIFVSMTYGRAEPGLPVQQRFGPVNGPTGHRRLNVLITRAKHRLNVFSSMTADDIRVGETSTRGLRALKGYLAFARTGHLEGQVTQAGREPDSDFEIGVASAVRAAGYEVVHQVGVAGYFVDLGVKHPRETDAFLLGIECDGATYHRSHCARDRDRLRQQVLEGLGWNIHRVWSTDWFKDRQRETDRIVSRIKDLLSKGSQKARPEGHGRQHENGSEDVAAIRMPTPTADKLMQPEPVPRQPPVSTGQVQRGPFSAEDARRELITLRENVIRAAFPQSDPAKGLLRKSMLEIFLRERPRTYAEWVTAVPVTLRNDTDSAQISRFLKDVLAIISKYTT